MGISHFSEIRNKGYYYVDKSGLIRQILSAEGRKITLITRPRRFGKTLAMSMLAHFFDMSKDSKALFKGLEIEKNDRLCDRWMNQYPVLFLSFKDVDGTSFENAYNLLKYTIAGFCDEHAFLTGHPEITDAQRRMFERLKMQEATLADVQNSIALIMKMMQVYYGKRVILLLDEYDVPMAKASSKGYYAKMLEVIKAMMSTSLKDNTSLEFAVITGCLKIAEESIFNGTNNFVSDTIMSSQLNEYFGFTQAEVTKMLEAMDAESHADEIRAWYDGYHFGTYDIYCPWDVMNFMRDLLYDSNAKPASYWKNTSDNAVIRSFIDYAGDSIKEKLEILMSGGYITEHIEEDLTYDYLHSSEENLWSILYLTGYLTQMRSDNLKKSKLLSDDITALMIPNAEIKEIFETTVKKWFEDHAKTWNRKPLFEAVWGGDSEVITSEMNRLLRATISYHDYREDFYHAFLDGIFTGTGYYVQSNKEHGEGRSDLVVFDAREARVAVFEVKYTQLLKNLEKDCSTAIDQINEKMYAATFEDDYDQVLCYGISFFKKRCVVKKK